jgi:hypothetical protein
MKNGLMAICRIELLEAIICNLVQAQPVAQAGRREAAPLSFTLCVEARR